MAKFTIIKKPHPKQMFDGFKDGQKRELVSVAKKHVDARNGVVSDWVNKPEFGYRITLTPYKVQMTIFVRNASQKLTNSDATIGDLWRWVDVEGTPPHTIPASNAPRLAFRPKYSAKTKARPARAHVGDGISTGPLLRPKQVEHKGYPPRKFWLKFDKEYRNDFVAAVKRGVKTARRG